MIAGLILASSLVPPARADQTEKLPEASYKLQLDAYDLNLQSYKFPSGLWLLFQEDHSQPVVGITNVIDKGSEMDQAGREGIAHVIEHLAFRARHGDLPKNWDLIHQLGANINAYTSVDETVYLTVAPSDALVPLLRIEAMRLKDGVANITQQDVDTEVEICRNELRMRYENQGVGDGWDEVARQLWTPEWPYYRSTIGSHDSLTAIDLGDVQELVDNFYTAENSTIVVVGDFDMKDVPTFIQQAFGDLPELLYGKDYDPANPPAELELVQPEARVQCDSRKELPAPHPDATTPRVKGMVDDETVVLGWSVPAGFCEDENVMHFAAWLLTQYMYITLVPSWEFDDPDQSIEGLGCFVDTGVEGSTFVCFIEGSKGGYESEALIAKAADSLYLQWDPEAILNVSESLSKQAVDQSMVHKYTDRFYNDAKMSQMESVLSAVDLVSSLNSGRATVAARSAHYTGSPAYFSRSFNDVNKVTHEQVKQFASKYITRERMVSVIVEPMDEEERARREADAKRGDDIRSLYSGSTREKEYDQAFDPEKLTPEVIQRVTVAPDIGSIERFTLDNGLQVAIMNYGEAPMLHVGLKIFGDNQSAPVNGLDTFGEALARRGMGKAERILAVAGEYGEFTDDNVRNLVASGSSGNLEALLHSVRYETTNIDWRIGVKRDTINGWEDYYKGRGEDVENWVSRLQLERTFPEHRMGEWLTPQYWETMRTWGVEDLKGWINAKYQPANAELVIVGKITDMEAAKASVHKFFDGWQPQAGVKVGRISPAAAPTKIPERQVLLFDEPLSTQSNITLTCQLDWPDDSFDAKAQVMSDVLDEQIWRRLREESGVTYGAGSYAIDYPGATNMLYMSSLVQNDATGFGVTTMFALLEAMKRGEIEKNDVIGQKWARGRRYVLGHQSGSQMLDRLMSKDIASYEDFNTYVEKLSEVSGADFPKLLDTCVGHEVITIIGPKEYAERQLKEAGVSYEIVDWEGMLLSTLTPKEIKKRAKDKAKEEKNKAKEDAKKAEG